MKLKNSLMGETVTEIVKLLSRSSGKTLDYIDRSNRLIIAIFTYPH